MPVSTRSQRVQAAQPGRITHRMAALEKRLGELDAYVLALATLLAATIGASDTDDDEPIWGGWDTDDDDTDDDDDG